MLPARPRLWLAVSACLLAGCPAADPLQRQAVTGTVVFKGQPLGEGVVEFTPDDPAIRTSGGAAVKDGKFSIPKDKGLSAGRYKVRVNAPEAQGPPPAAPGEDSALPPKERIPEQFNAKSKLTAEVKAGAANQFEFRLE